MSRLSSMCTIAVLLGLAPIATGCSSQVLPPVDDHLQAGTWGGENAAVLVLENVAHVHVGCTLGDFSVPLELDEQQRFSVSGSYVLRAYPIQVGPRLPAQFAGVVSSGTLTFTVAVNDTVEKKLVVLGPVAVDYGREPRMQTCPICSMEVQR